MTFFGFVRLMDATFRPEDEMTAIDDIRTCSPVLCFHLYGIEAYAAVAEDSVLALILTVVESRSAGRHRAEWWPTGLQFRVCGISELDE